MPQIRDAFTPHNQPQRPLSHLLRWRHEAGQQEGGQRKQQGPPEATSAIADVTLCRPATRAVVDVYAVDHDGDGDEATYSLVVPSLDLMSWLWGQDVPVRLTEGKLSDALFPSVQKQSTNEVLWIFWGRFLFLLL